MWTQENVQVSDKTLDSCKWKRKEILEVYLLLKQYSAKTSCVIMTVKKRKKNLQDHYYQSHFSQRKLKITEVRQFAEVL